MSRRDSIFGISRSIASFFIMAIAFTFAASMFEGCEGSATQTTTGGQNLVGVLVDGNGHPVSGAIVKAWPAGAFLLGSADNSPAAQGETDGMGRYALSGLQSGKYNVFGDKGKGAYTVFIPKVDYKNAALDIGVDTLTPPGTITGKVLALGKPMRGVFCYLPGTSRVTMTDSLGIFALDRIPAGTYPLYYTTAGYTTEVDSPVVVESGKIKSLQPKNLTYDISLQPPAPIGLAVRRDSITGILTLTWQAPEVSDLAGYNIERVITGILSTDTILKNSFSSDSIQYSDEMPREIFSRRSDFLEWGEFSLKINMATVTYRIKSIDLDSNRSKDYSSPVSIRIYPIEVQKNFAVTLFEGIGANDSARCRDTLVFRTTSTEPARFHATPHFQILGWYEGSPDAVPVYNEGQAVENQQLSPLKWYLGLPQIKKTPTKPAGMDSATWESSHYYVPISDFRKPDSIQVSASININEWGVGSSSTSSVVVHIDAQGCYRVGPSHSP